MNDAPMGAEMPVSPKLENLAKTPTKPPKQEAPVSAPEKSPAPAEARVALEQIAVGPTQEATQASPATPEVQGTQAEQTTPAGPAGAEGKAELGPDKEKVNTILTQGAELMLHKGDPRVAIAAVARSAAPTPLGTELRRDVLDMMAEMNGDKLSAEGKTALTKLKQDIEAMKLPPTDPARSAFAGFLENYSKDNPDKAISPTVIEAIRTKKEGAAQTMTHVLQTDTGLSAKLWAEMKGDGTQPVPNVGTPEGLLKASGVEATPENTAKVQKLFEPKGPHPMVQLWQEIKNDVPSILITTGMVVSMVSQLVMSDTGQGGGH